MSMPNETRPLWPAVLAAVLIFVGGPLLSLWLYSL